MSKWRVVLTPAVAAACRGFPPDVKRTVREALAAIGRDPQLGKELARELTGLRSYRARRYRVVYEIARADREVRVVAIAHRTTVYEELAAARARRS